MDILVSILVALIIILILVLVVAEFVRRNSEQPPVDRKWTDPKFHD